MEKIKNFRGLIFTIWSVFVLLLSVLRFNFIDAQNIESQSIHFILYFITAIFGYVYFSKFIKNKKLLSTASVIFTCLLGVLTEGVQYILSYGTFSTNDITANCLGAIMFGIIVIPKRKLTIYGQKV